MSPIFKNPNFFPIAMAASIGFHASLFGVSQVLPTPVQYPVQQAPNSISVMLVEEIPPVPPAVPEPVVEKIASEIQQEIETPPAPVKKKQPEERPQQESQQSLGAQVEAAPLEFVNPAPAYPALARRRGWEGTTVIQVRVEKDGRPSSVVVVESSGYSVLDEAALETIRTWRFKPAQSGPLVFASTINIPVKFRLVEDDGSEDSF